MHDDQTVEVLKALADKTRLDIVRNLKQIKPNESSACSSLSNCSSLSQPAMSHHFSKLVDAKILLETKRGTEKFYSLNTEYLSSLGLDITKL